MKILLVDDDPDVRNMAKKMMETSGYDVITAADGMDALNQLNNSPDIAAVITDIIMPNKEGMEFIQELRAMDSSIKILAVSGGGHVSAYDYLNMASVIGADAVLAKPFLKEELLTAFEKMFIHD